MFVLTRQATEAIVIGAGKGRETIVVTVKAITADTVLFGIESEVECSVREVPPVGELPTMDDLTHPPNH
jgi:sRNA-binding carbon storage regulator CsrA